VSAAEPLLEIRDLTVQVPGRRGLYRDRAAPPVRTVDDVSLQIDRGESYGLVGETGCGKATVGRAILRTVTPTAGQVVLHGANAVPLFGEQCDKAGHRVREVLQEPRRTPRRSVGSLLVDGMRMHGLSPGPGADDERLQELLDAVGLPASALRRSLREFAGGERRRVDIAMALCAEPDLIVADEPVAALDVSVRAQVLNLLGRLRAERGLSYLVIARDLAVVRHVTDRVGVMYLGRLVEEASSRELYTDPQHPYTRALLSAVSVPDPEVQDRRERIVLRGDLPTPAAAPSGCPFHTRCPWRRPGRCEEERPLLRVIPGTDAGHRVACHHAEDIRSGIGVGRIHRLG
jgi:peptide/nickel transport system ATP-binding protein